MPVTLLTPPYLVLAIFTSTHQSFITAHALIFLGYEFDRFDGMIARWRNETSEMGKQLDSFSYRRCWFQTRRDTSPSIFEAMGNLRCGKALASGLALTARMVSVFPLPPLRVPISDLV